MQASGSRRRFCTQCGSPVAADDKFCSSCGGPVASPAASYPNSGEVLDYPPQPPMQPAPAPVSGGEPVIGAVLASRKKGVFAIESFHIIVTPRRIIGAAFTPDMVKQAAKEAGQSGFFAGLVGAATVGFTYYKKYLSMPPEVALRENPQNFEIPLNVIRKLTFDMGGRHRDPQTRRETWDDSKLEIETAGEKFSFRVPHSLHDQAADVLRKGRLI